MRPSITATTYSTPAVPLRYVADRLLGLLELNDSQRQSPD